jgi:hypothetical protein
MRIIRAVMATTHVDRHNDRLPLEALRSMKQHIDTAYLPFIVGHDPRCPPIGRVVRAEITTLPDGEHAIEADVEVFEPGDEVRSDGRTVHYRPLPADDLILTVDRTFSQEEFESAVAAIARLFGTAPVYEVKKALDPIAVIGIGLGTVAVGKFAGAFFSKLGSNAADALCAHLKEVFRRKSSDGQVRLLRIELDFAHEGRQCRAEMIVTGPSESDIEGLLRDGLVEVDRLLPMYLATDVTRYVFEYASGQTVLKFAVRSDAVPVFPTRESEA